VSRLNCRRCTRIACVCAVLAAHEEQCALRRATTGAVAIACDHGRDVCPLCDPCTCATPPTAAMAYGPDRPDEGGRRNPTNAEVIVLGGHAALCVGDQDPVPVKTLPGGSGDWAEPGKWFTIRRVQLGHIRRPGWNRLASLAAKLAMSSLASRMHPDSGPLRSSDPVAYWDLRTSMDDQRAALCLAGGIPVEHVRRDGYDISRR
jgi:hypothetical protein